MGSSRRDFMKDAAVVGAVAATGGVVPADGVQADEQGAPETGGERCPYFDQPMYCQGLSKTGKPLCEE